MYIVRSGHYVQVPHFRYYCYKYNDRSQVKAGQRGDRQPDTTAVGRFTYVRQAVMGPGRPVVSP